MSDAITDTSGQPLLYVNLSLTELTDSPVVVVLVPCAAGKWLAASPVVAAAYVEARRTSSGDLFQDLSVAPIDLTPWDGQTISFDFKVHANDVSGLQRVALPVRVTFQP
jgi:phage terminase large subunit-like protein